MRTFTKTYDHPLLQQRSLAHQRWIAGVNPDVRTPQVVEQRPGEIVYEHLDGCHVGPADLVVVADLLGHQHTSAYLSVLKDARPDTAFTSGGTTIDGFVDGRRERLRRLLASGSVPGPALTPEAAAGWLQRAADMPAAFYKDANPRNFLVTDTAVAVIDFDSLTLAPFGYDLAKLVVSTTMTSGPLVQHTVQQALDTYNDHPRSRGLPGRSRREFAAWCEFHHALTAQKLAAVPGVRVTPGTSMNIRIGTAKGEQIDSLSSNAVPASALGTTVTPPVVSGSLTSLPENFLVVDEHAAQSDGLSVGEQVVTLLPSGARVSTVVAAVVARGLNGDDTYLSASLTGAVMPSRVYLDSQTGAGRPLDEQQTVAVNQALAGSGARIVTYDDYLEAQRAHAAEQTDNAAVIVLGIALAYALIAVANTLIMAMAGRRREFALLGMAGVVRSQIVKVAAAESAIAVVVATVLAAVATGLAAVTQHVSLSRLATAPPTVIPWTQIGGTIALCALVTLVTALQATGRATRQWAIEAAGIRE
ncbi:FtsX-like permease family protein [Kitasatospora sp. NPDC101176]|uniref:FtsX-like permease family protein n=1 Tax=Kitasatospora sp. NPDC101176 TaxID=3364099 RepID=UPI0038029970